MKKILCASFLTLLLSSCMQHYYVVRTEGTGIKAYNSESTDIYLTEPYKGNPKQGGRIYVRIRKTEKNILTVLVEREDIKDGSRYYWDPEYNRTFKLLDTPVITDINGKFDNTGALTSVKRISVSGNIGSTGKILTNEDLLAKNTVTSGTIAAKNLRVDNLTNDGKISTNGELIAKDVKNIVAVKEASGNISQIAKIAALTERLDFDIYSGNDDQVVAVCAMGGKGVISVASHVIPKQMHEMVMSFRNGDTKKALDIQNRYLNLINTLFIDVNPIPVKEAMNLLGYDVGGFRKPLTPMSDAHREILRKELINAGVLK